MTFPPNDTFEVPGHYSEWVRNLLKVTCELQVLILQIMNHKETQRPWELGFSNQLFITLLMGVSHGNKHDHILWRYTPAPLHPTPIFILLLPTQEHHDLLGGVFPTHSWEPFHKFSVRKTLTLPIYQNL